MQKPKKKIRYTCTEYREEMRLLGLRKRLQESALSETEKAALEEEIQRIEAALEMD